MYTHAGLSLSTQVTLLNKSFRSTKLFCVCTFADYSINHSGALHHSVCGQACKICKCTHTQDFHFPLKAHYSISHSGAWRCSACAQAHAWLNAHHTQNHQSCKRVFFKMMKYRIHHRNSLTGLKKKKKGTSPPSLLGHQEMSPSALQMMLHGHPHLAGKYNKSH